MFSSFSFSRSKVSPLYCYHPTKMEYYSYFHLVELLLILIFTIYIYNLSVFIYLFLYTFP